MDKRSLLASRRSMDKVVFLRYTVGKQEHGCVRRWGGGFSPYTCCIVSPSFQSQFMI